MAPSEYSTPGGGGKLKLKGSKTSNGRIEKKKKKSSSKKSSVPGSGEESEQQKNQQEQQLTTTTTTTSATASGAEEEPPRTDEHEPSSASGSAGAGKTEAERKYEEMRRKRLQERLKREGVKTHKERVEELNKYLSRLSEHHDMPKIGPG
ncbi:DUF1754-domain-containing protein [Aspergillus vadensis CBS 113365]|uniref:DUF1754-domain-containing protein n=1 Tax=Aspergillus vadensis (strain CBS 113365 / IMI 142717 / IBT 24658) TaxID=1448311 RepID=A0A319AXQ4_ASPVC|nr:DUF1754-domain-containing protein [Aspergillus vadensis CBS 113365]PYH64201.1 DUF1754-domain-containing protein [Aspergillus vadensis CBS 113365]